MLGGRFLNTISSAICCFAFQLTELDNVFNQLLHRDKNLTIKMEQWSRFSQPGDTDFNIKYLVITMELLTASQCTPRLILLDSQG